MQIIFIHNNQFVLCPAMNCIFPFNIPMIFLYNLQRVVIMFIWNQLKFSNLLTIPKKYRKLFQSLTIFYSKLLCLSTCKTSTNNLSLQIANYNNLNISLSLDHNIHIILRTMQLIFELYFILCSTG